MAEDESESVDVVGSKPAAAVDVSAESAGASASAEAPAGVMELDSDLEEIPQEPDGMKVDMCDELTAENDDSGAGDQYRMPRETLPFPVVHAPQEVELEGRKLKVIEKIEQEAVEALGKGDGSKAVEKYTEAMRMGGSTALLLAMRALVLLQLRRPCAAIRDCTAAIQINSMILKAYRIRGILHRKLGNWRKAHRDLTQAQSLNFDEETAVMQKFVAEKLSGKKAASKPVESIEIIEDEPVVTASKPAQKTRTSAAPAMTTDIVLPSYIMIGCERFIASPSSIDQEFDQGQAVIACCLKGAAHLNGKRGVVQRRDPHPSRKGRWEVELRHDAGRVETVALKADNVMTLNKLDKDLCKSWIKEEKKHKEMVKLRDAENDLKQQAQQETEAKRQREAQAPGSAKQEEENLAPPARVQKKIKALAIKDSVRTLLTQLAPEQALEILEKATKGSGIANLNAYLTTQAKLILGDDSDDDDADADNGNGDEDEGRMPEETEPFPRLSADNGEDVSDAQLELAASAKRQALEATERSDLAGAVKKYTEAICAGGATALLLAKRAELLMKQKRPCAAVRDCTEALEVNPDSCKAHRIRGLARRALGHWEDALKDLERAQKLEYDDSIVKVQNFVALQVNALQERGPAKRGKSGGGPPAKRAKAN